MKSKCGASMKSDCGNTSSDVHECTTGDVSVRARPNDHFRTTVNGTDFQLLPSQSCFKCSRKASKGKLHICRKGAYNLQVVSACA